MGFALPCFLILCVVFIASLGLLLSLFGRSSTLGVTATLGFIAAWWIVTPLLLALLRAPMESHASGANPFVAAYLILALWLPESEMGRGVEIQEAIAPIVGGNGLHSKLESRVILDRLVRLPNALGFSRIRPFQRIAATAHREESFDDRKHGGPSLELKRLTFKRAIPR